MPSLCKEISLAQDLGFQGLWPMDVLFVNKQAQSKSKHAAKGYFWEAQNTNCKIEQFNFLCWPYQSRTSFLTTFYVSYKSFAQAWIVILLHFSFIKVFMLKRSKYIYRQSWVKINTYIHSLWVFGMLYIAWSYDIMVKK